MAEPAAPPYDVVVVAGGGGRRLGGTDKPALAVGGRTLLDRVLDATAHAAHTVVVGERRPVDRPVSWTLEQPPGSGPAAAVAAGLRLVTAARVVLLAADLPFLTAGLVDRLAGRVTDGGAVAVDPAGREQWLISAWRTEALRVAPLPPGGSLRAALAPLSWVRVELPDGAGLDCDTPADLERARERA